MKIKIDKIKQIISEHKFAGDRVLALGKAGFSTIVLETYCGVGDTFKIHDARYIKVTKGYGKYSFAHCVKLN